MSPVPIPGVPGGEFQLDEAGIGNIIRGPGLRAALAEAANGVARTALAGEGVENVWVDTYTTDRAAAAVTIAVRGGPDSELKYGILSDAALSNGLEYASRAGGGDG